MNNFRFKKSNPKKICMGCHMDIEADSHYDGEDWWHKKCWNDFVRRLGYDKFVAH